jgi:NAD+ kinase
MDLRNVLIVGNPDKPELAKVLTGVTVELERRGAKTFCVKPQLIRTPQGVITGLGDGYRHRAWDLVLALGGDGTFLYTVRSFHGFHIPILGVNLGRLGFLMEVDPSKIGDALDGVVSGRIGKLRRMVLDVSVVRETRTVCRFSFLNDAVISKGALSRMVEMEIRLDREELASYRADGLIVSTPTGSTAYSLAAGGPIMTPDIDAMAITPICPHTLGIRPIVMPASRKLAIRIVGGEENTALTVDGQENFTLRKGDVIEFPGSASWVDVYDYGEGRFFSVLREKLGWNV